MRFIGRHLCRVTVDFPAIAYSLALPPVPVGFNGMHTSEETKFLSDSVELLADEEERREVMQSLGSTHQEAKEKRGRGFSSSSFGVLRAVMGTTPPDSTEPEGSEVSSASRMQPLWAAGTPSSRLSLLEQIGGRKLQWVKEGDEEAAAAAARQPIWLLQHQEQLLRRNQQQRVQHQILQMRHRLNCLQLPFVADPKTQMRFEVYTKLRVCLSSS